MGRHALVARYSAVCALLVVGSGIVARLGVSFPFILSQLLHVFLLGSPLSLSSLSPPSLSRVHLSALFRCSPPLSPLSPRSFFSLRALSLLSLLVFLFSVSLPPLSLLSVVPSRLSVCSLFLPLSLFLCPCLVCIPVSFRLFHSSFFVSFRSVSLVFVHSHALSRSMFRPSRSWLNFFHSCLMPFPH